MKCILLNTDYSFLNVINWQKAICLLVKGRVEVVADSDKKVSNCDRSVVITVPKVMSLKRMRELFRNRVPFSKKNVLIRDEFRCVYCGRDKIPLTIDHVVPKSKGGKSNFENCVASCKPCNEKKGDKSPQEAGMYLRRKPVQPTIAEFHRIRMERVGARKILEELGIY